jgi:hypothetical protein
MPGYTSRAHAVSCAAADRATKPAARPDPAKSDALLGAVVHDIGKVSSLTCVIDDIKWPDDGGNPADASTVRE